MDEEISGRAWKLGDNIDTDLIIAGPYLTIRDEEELISHALEALIPNFADQVCVGDIIVAGTNFGTGSSREEAVFILKRLGIRVIVAESFARIFYRNAINLGFLAIQIEGISSEFATGDNYVLKLKESTIQNTRTGNTFSFEPLPDFLMEIYRAGGALEKLKAEFSQLDR